MNSGNPLSGLLQETPELEYWFWQPWVQSSGASPAVAVNCLDGARTFGLGSLSNDDEIEIRSLLYALFPVIGVLVDLKLVKFLALGKFHFFYSLLLTPLYK